MVFFLLFAYLMIFEVTLVLVAAKLSLPEEPGKSDLPVLEELSVEIHIVLTEFVCVFL